MASKILRVILIIVLFIVFFELGLFSSYTIVTAEAPNFHGLVDMQISKIQEFFNPQKVNDVLIKDPTPVNISNKKDVALKMESLSKVDGVNVDCKATYGENGLRADKNTVTITSVLKLY